MVEDYIRKNLGPTAVLGNMRETAEILSRLGPRLPGLASELLMLAEETRLKRSKPVVEQRQTGPGWPTVALAALVGALVSGLIVSL